MKREILITADGSVTISIAEMDVTYRSRRGAISESMHVFINAGLKPLLATKPVISIFEMGFGTGLNALLTCKVALAAQQHIYYYTTEKFPLNKEEYSLLNYAEEKYANDIFEKLHSCNWENDCSVHEYFILHKTTTALEKTDTGKLFDLIYYDAFAPRAQPELWTTDIFKQLYNLLLPNGILVTYCSKGEVRRAMIAAGFTVEKLQGPPGKREMLRCKRES